MILLYIRSALGEVFRSIRYQKLKLHSVKGEKLDVCKWRVFRKAGHIYIRILIAIHVVC